MFPWVERAERASRGVSIDRDMILGEQLLSITRNDDAGCIMFSWTDLDAIKLDGLLIQHAHVWRLVHADGVPSQPRHVSISTAMGHSASHRHITATTHNPTD